MMPIQRSLPRLAGKRGLSEVFLHEQRKPVHGNGTDSSSSFQPNAYWTSSQKSVMTYLLPMKSKPNRNP